MQTDESTKIATIKRWLGSGSVNIFGRQFSGKDTQCKLLARDLNGITFGGGDILRNSELPAHAKEAIDAGELSPTDVYRQTVIPYFSKPEFHGKPLILSTVGRMKGEETVIISAAKETDHEIKAVIFLDIDEQTVWDRYEQSQHDGTREVRPDDGAHEKIMRRLELYRTETTSVIDVYREMGIVDEVDGAQNIDSVYEDIVNALYNRATR